MTWNTWDLIDKDEACARRSVGSTDPSGQQVPARLERHSLHAFGAVDAHTREHARKTSDGSTRLSDYFSRGRFDSFPQECTRIADYFSRDRFESCPADFAEPKKASLPNFSGLSPPLRSPKRSSVFSPSLALLDPDLPIDEPISPIGRSRSFHAIRDTTWYDSTIWADTAREGRALTDGALTSALDTLNQLDVAHCALPKVNLNCASQCVNYALEQESGPCGAESNSPKSHVGACYVWSDVTTTESLGTWEDAQHQHHQKDRHVNGSVRSVNKSAPKNAKDEALARDEALVHDMLRCKPCAFFHRDEGCQNADSCDFCHLCPPGEIKRRKKEKALHKKQEALLRKRQQPGVPVSRRTLRVSSVDY
eukprot:GEMP01034723.1.p1 GENE.GEMP01034723.1~~GEMP01034723.1.p1  ORF type:complete len:365 (+),score=100.21 GEMP01034723.1:234-1328(+)